MNLTVDNITYSVTVASAASDTTVTTSGSGTSLINTSTGGTHVLNSVTGGANVTITDDNAGNLTIAATDTEDNLSNNSTSDLSEGTNQYFTDARVMTSLETVSGNIIPDGDNTRSLGSATKEWKEVFIGPGSLYIDGHKILGSSATGQIDITTDAGQNLNVQAGADIIMVSTNSSTRFNDNAIHLGPAANTATVTAHGNLDVTGTLDIDSAEIGALAITGLKIANATGNIELETTTASAFIHAKTSDLYVGADTTAAVKIDESSITTTAGNLTIGAFGTVDVAGHNTTAETATLTATAKTEAIASAESKDGVRATAANAYADAAVAVLTSGASAAFDTLVEIKTLMDSGDATLNTAIGNLNHDTLSGFVANEHIDWTTDQGATNIHAGNYTDTDTVFTSANAISAVEGEATLDLTGDVTIPSTKSISSSTTNGDLSILSNGTGKILLDDLVVNNANSGYGEAMIMLEPPVDHVLALKTTGNGYVFAVAPQTWIGNAAGAYFQSNSGAASTLKPFGGQHLAIGPNSSMTVSLEGDVTGNLTGDVTGNLTAAKTYANIVVSNKSDLTVPGISQWGGWNMLDNGGGLASTTLSPNQTGGGYPLVGISQSNSASPQPQAQYLVNHMDYDISGGLSGGAGVSVQFAAQDESGKLIDIASNLCKIRASTVSGSAGSSTVDTWDSEYTLTVMSNAGSGNVGTNVITTNVDFTEVSTELRVVDKPGNSGNINLSGVWLTYDGAETGTPTAKIKLRNNGTDTTTSLIELTEGKVDFKKVVNLASNTTSEQNALTGAAGDMLFNSTTSKFMGYNGSAWVELG